MAGFGRFKVLSIDYRRPPESPYPAALDDSVAVWKGALKMADPKNMAIFGTSAGGALTLSTVLRAKQERSAAARRHRAGHADVRSDERPATRSTPTTWWTTCSSAATAAATRWPGCTRTDTT